MCGCPSQHIYSPNTSRESTLTLALHVVFPKERNFPWQPPPGHHAVIYLASTKLQTWLCNDTCLLCERPFWSLFTGETADPELHRPSALQLTDPPKSHFCGKTQGVTPQDRTSLLNVSLSDTHVTPATESRRSRIPEPQLSQTHC